VLIDNRFIAILQKKKSFYLQKSSIGTGTPNYFQNNNFQNDYRGFRVPNSKPSLFRIIGTLLL